MLAILSNAQLRESGSVRNSVSILYYIQNRIESCQRNSDFEEALKALKSGQAITGKDGVLAPLIKQLTEAALEGEIESHIANDVVPNRRNGKSKKTIKSTSGNFELETPRDRACLLYTSPSPRDS